MEADNGVPAIVGPTQNLGELGLRHVFCDLGDFCDRLVQRFLALFVGREVEEKTCLLKAGTVFLPSLDETLESSLLFQDTLSLFAVVPEIRLGCDSI
jgi:hypothetical protein